MPRPTHHTDDIMHPWVFIQNRVWVDTAGQEHVIDDMPDDYVANVINFCRDHAGQIRRLVEGYSMDELLEGLKTGKYDHERTLDYRKRDHDETLEWLEATPLIRALHERLGNPSAVELAKLVAAAQSAYKAKQKSAKKSVKRPKR